MNNKTSAILRMYGVQSEGSERIVACEKLVQKLIDFQVARVQILIASDFDTQDYYQRMRDSCILQSFGRDEVLISQNSGNPFTDVLNDGVERDLKDGFERSLVVSSEVGEHLEHYHLELMHEALDIEKVGVSCLAVSDPKYGGELKKSILDGALAHTCCLRDTGIFDQELNFYADGNDGVEEIGALMRLIDSGHKTAPIDTGIEYKDFSSTGSYQLSKFPSKKIRQTNAYILYLQATKQISRNDFLKVYRSKIGKGEYLAATDENLRAQYYDEMRRKLGEAIYKKYSKR